MNGLDHYRAAQKILQGIDPDPSCNDISVSVAVAQVHATLALAAATVLNDADGGTPAKEYRAWLDVVKSVRD